MKYFAVLFLFLSSCTLSVDFRNYSQYPDDLFFKAHDAIQEIAGKEVDLKNFKIRVFESTEDFNKFCPDITRLGCTDGKDKLALRGSVGTNQIEVATELAHQMGHIYYYQKDKDDFDGAHLHAEWFGEGGVEEKTHYLASKLLEKEQ